MIILLCKQRSSRKDGLCLHPKIICCVSIRIRPSVPFHVVPFHLLPKRVHFDRSVLSQSEPCTVCSHQKSLRDSSIPCQKISRLSKMNVFFIFLVCVFHATWKLRHYWRGQHALLQLAKNRLMVSLLPLRSNECTYAHKISRIIVEVCERIHRVRHTFNGRAILA